MQATITPSAASMPTVSVQLLRKCFTQLSIRTCRHGGGEHVVLAATAVCMCLQTRGSATFSTSSLLRTWYEKGAKSSLYRALPDITSNRRYIGSSPCQQISSSLYRPFRYSGPRYIGPPTVIIMIKAYAFAYLFDMLLPSSLQFQYFVVPCLSSTVFVPFT